MPTSIVPFVRLLNSVILKHLTLLSTYLSTGCGIIRLSLLWLPSIALALIVANLVYTNSGGQQEYTQFIVGGLAWGVRSKQQDFASLYIFAIGFVIACVCLVIEAGILYKKKGPHVVSEFSDLLLLGCLPGILWLGWSLFGDQQNLNLVLLSGWLVLLVVVLAMIAGYRDIEFRPQEFFDCIAASLIVILLAGTIPLGIATVYRRVALGTGWTAPHSLDYAVAVAVVVSVTMITFLWSPISRDVVQVRTRMRRLLIIAQGGLPLMFCVLIPPPWREATGLYQGYTLDPALWVVVAVVVALSYVDLVRRMTQKINSPGFASCLSPICVVALLVFLKIQDAGLPNISTDDYHTGEYLLPYWSWAKGAMVPYWDYSPARGIPNYFEGWLANIFFDGTAASRCAIYPLMWACYYLIAFPAIALAIGFFPTLLGLLLLPIGLAFTEIDLMITASLCLLCYTYLRFSRTAWLTFWIGIGTVAVLFAPGQGGLLVIATMPLGFVALKAAMKDDRRHILVPVAMIILFGMVAILTPLGKMIIGAVRYGIEQSSVNAVANGIVWVRDQGWGWTWQVVRSSWIGVAALAMGLIIYSKILDTSKRRLLLTYTVPISLILILFIARAAGRIDSGMSRMGIASAWAMALLLPILVGTCLPSDRHIKGYLIVAAVAAVVCGAFGQFGTININNALTRPLTTVDAGALFDSAIIGMPNIGKAIIDSNQLKRLQGLKSVLDKVVDPGETYLDLTNRNADYFYLGFIPPIESGAFYNIVHDNQQIRAVEALHKKRPPVIVISADNILHDGGSAALRSHLLYRYAISNYLPVDVGGYVYLALPDRIDRIKSDNGDLERRSEYHEKQLSILDKVFWQRDLQGIPASWGRSINSLQNDMLEIVRLFPGSIRLNGLEHKEGTVVATTNRQLVITLSGFSVNGSDAGLLVFRYKCIDGKDHVPIEVQWDTTNQINSEGTNTFRFNAINGYVVIPLDSAPRWLMSKRIRSIVISSSSHDQCSVFDISEIGLYQRKNVEQVKSLIDANSIRPIYNSSDGNLLP